MSISKYLEQHIPTLHFCPPIDSKCNDEERSVSTFATVSLGSSFSSVDDENISISTIGHKKVTFDQRQPIVHALLDIPPASEMEDAERRQLWYGPDDIMRFNHSVSVLCRTSQRKHTTSMPCVLQRMYCTTQIDEADREAFIRFSTNSMAKRGLETRLQMQDKCRPCDVIVHAVLVLQSNQNIPADAKATMIRRCSERITEADRRFALVTASLHWEAARAAQSRLPSHAANSERRIRQIEAKVEQEIRPYERRWRRVQQQGSL